MNVPRSVRALCAVLVLLVGASGCGWFDSAEKQIARAERHIAAGEDRLAAIELKNALESQPANVHARLLLAEVSLRLDDLRFADKEVNAAAEHGAPEDQVADLRARILLGKKAYEELATALDSKAIALNEPALSTYRALAFLGVGRAEEAIASFEKALEVDPDWQRARIGLAEAYGSQGKLDMALEQLDLALDREDGNALGWLLKGTILARQGEHEAAVTALREARRHSPGQLSASQNVALLATLMEAQLGSGAVAEASETLATIAKQAPEAPLTRLLSARLAMVKQDYSTAIAETQKALSAAPQLLQAKLLLGAALLANGNLNQAEAHLSELVQQAPDSLEARKLLAQANLRLNRSERAAQVLQTASTDVSGDPEADALLGLAKLQGGEDEAAIALMERSLVAQPDNRELKLELALAYLRSGANDKALALLKGLDTRADSSRREALLIAAVAAAQGREAAIAEAERIVADDPKNVRVLNVAASFFAQLRDFARARTYLDTAQAIEPNNAITLANRARIELAAGEDDRARAVLVDLARANPADHAARIALAQIAFRNGREEEATRWLEEIRRADPKAHEPRLLLAAAYLRQSKAREAGEVIREALAAAENKAAVNSAVGQLYLQFGRFDEAVASLREATRLDASQPTYFVNLARAQVALGNDAAARESLRKALSVDPDLLAAHAAMVMLDLRGGRTQQAADRVADLKKQHANKAAVSILEGDFAMATKAYAQAEQAYGAAFTALPSGALAVRHYRARQLAGMADAAAPLRRWLELRPNDAEVRMLLAEAYAAQGKRKASMAEYERVVELAPSNAMALNNLAWMYFEDNDRRAEGMAKRAYDLAPQVPAIADTYGWILARTGKYEAALPVLERAATGQRVQADIRYHYAVVLNEVGRRDEARAVLRSLLQGGETFADLDAARRLLGELGG